MRVVAFALASIVALVAPSSALAEEPQRDGWADISVTIGTDGTVKDAHVIKSSGEWVNVPAVDAIKRWRYRKPSRQIRSVVHVKLCMEQEPADASLATEECREQRAGQLQTP
jgi:TonB family protein